jgi:uncharacterized protein YdeI (YjbR/CyaY-like superfamily)
MELHFESREPWRGWLEAHHDDVREVWLVFFKKHTGKPSIPYDDAVEEALCFGWVDSLIKRLDNDRYARKFTPRTDTSKWSASNLARFEKLEHEGLMTAAGRVKRDPAATPVIPPSQLAQEVPPSFQSALDANPEARAFFDGLAPSYRRQFIGWITAAKRETTRQRRVAEAIALLENHRKLGMK